MNILPHKHPKNRWVLHLTMRCNYACPYCIQKEIITKENKRRVNQYNELTGRQWLDFFTQIHYHPATTIIMGGEPSLHPDFVDILYGLTKLGHYIDITSNLSFDADKVICRVKELGFTIPTIWSTYHPAQGNVEQYFENVRKINASGILSGKITCAWMDTEKWEHLLDDQYRTDLARFHELCGQNGISAQHSWIRGQAEGRAYRRERDNNGNKITEHKQCFSSWVNVAPDGDIYNCAYHMGERTHCFGNITDPENIRRMPEYGEWFGCTDWGWCEACHEQSGHGGFRD